MVENRDAWAFRDGLDARMAAMEAHVENIYHHVKRIDVLLEKQNSRIRENEFTISKWRGVAVGVVVLSTTLSTIIGIIIKLGV
jgi:hypothetical protein